MPHHENRTLDAPCGSTGFFTFPKDKEKGKTHGSGREGFRVAAVQLSPVLLDRDGTTEKVIKAIEKCGQEGISRKVVEEMVPEFQEISEKSLEGKEQTGEEKEKR
jgi:hypothetical protein